MRASWMARRWCVVEHDDQHDLFVGKPWHTHLVDINLRLDVPVERTLCGDLLPARPVFTELLGSILPQLCPECVLHAQSQRNAATAPRERASAGRTASLRSGETADGCRQIDLGVVQGD